MSNRAIAADVVRANIDYFSDFARKYDRYESPVFNPFFQSMLIDDLDEITAAKSGVQGAPTALDCGGGTGNVALKLLERQWAVSVVDVSSEMLTVLLEKCRERRFAPTLFNQTIETYLANTTQLFDLVCFASVLHHLYSYEAVIELVSRRVRRGGYFYANFDPVVPQRPWMADAIISLDTLAAKAMYDASDIVPGIARRARKLVKRASPIHQRKVASLGDIADYHAGSGVNDERIRLALCDNGFDIVEHVRYGAGRTSFIRTVNQACGWFQFWKIKARKRT